MMMWDDILEISIRLCLVSKKYQAKKKKIKKNDFFMFDYILKNIKENKI